MLAILSQSPELASTSPSSLVGFLFVGNILLGIGSIGYCGLAFDSMTEFPISESYSTGCLEMGMQLAGAILTQMATGRFGFVLCAAVTWASAICFVGTYR